VTTQFLLRPRPLPDESLSSWRQRVGWANGYRLFPLGSGTLRRSDPDLGTHSEEFPWITATHAVGEAAVKAMTFRRFLGLIIPEIQSRHHPPWWLRARYGTSERSYGAMYCPCCLREDTIPYFRLSWRLAFNVACDKHGTELLDRCQSCGAPPWPAGCGVVDQLSSRFAALDNCWRCGDRLSLHTTAKADTPAFPNVWLENGCGELGGRRIPVIELLSALRAICQLFIRRRTRELLSTAPAYARISNALASSTVDCALEYLPVQERAALICIGTKLLADWPTQFVLTMQECGISRVHFSGATHLHPVWMDEVINRTLAKQNRWVSEAKVRETVREMRIAEEVVTKAAIRRRLSWQGLIDSEWLKEGAAERGDSD